MDIILRNNRGIALVMVLLIIAVLLGITGASVFFSGLDSKIASNHNTGSTALQVADAGIQNALAVIPAGTTFTYGSGATVVSTTAFPTASSGYSYVVTATNNPSTSPSTSTAILTSTASGPNSSTRAIRGYIGRSTTSWAPPGAFYVPGPGNPSDYQFQGTATITGNDYNVDGTPGPHAAIPGIGTNSDATTQNVKSGITTPANVTGAGGTTPNVATTTSPLDINALANSFLTYPHVNACSGSTFGTFAAPQITYCSSNMQLQSTTSGAGVLIVDGLFQIQADFSFQGIILVRNGEFQVQGTAATLYGTVMVSPAQGLPQVDIQGSGVIRYSSQAINNVSSNWPLVLPQKAKLIAWSEVMQ